jgi:hypothetical protein
MAPRAINEARGVLEKVAPKGEAELRETIRQQKGEINTLKPMAEHAQDLQKKIGLRNKLALGGTVAGAGGLAYGLNEKKKSQQPYSGTMESYQ